MSETSTLIGYAGRTIGREELAPMAAHLLTGVHCKEERGFSD